MPTRRFYDAKYYRDWAVEIRALKGTMKNVEAQAMMSRLADDYDKLAERAELRAKADPDAGSVQQIGPGL